MNARSIAHDCAVLQQLPEFINGRPMMDNGDVWCPMCEAYHVNNTMCQMTMEGY